MTIRETILFVRMLLDDGMDWYNKQQHVVDVINEAQLRMIDYWVSTGNERALRPLFKFDQYVPDMRNPSGSQSIEVYEVIGNNTVNRKPLYVRSVLVSLNDISNPLRDSFILHANYMPPELFLNNEGTTTSYNQNGTFVQRSLLTNLYYTIQRRFFAGEYHNYLLYTDGDTIFDSYGIVGFVALPLLFSETQSLEVASEYHYEVCTLAAEILNGNDVGEKMRSKVAVPEFGQKLDIITLGTTDPPRQQERR